MQTKSNNSAFADGQNDGSKHAAIATAGASSNMSHESHNVVAAIGELILETKSLTGADLIRIKAKLSERSDFTAASLSNAISLLRSAGGDLFTQAALHAQLVRIGAEKKSRRLKILLLALLIFACLLCVMLFVATRLLAISWETPYRTWAAITLILVYAVGVVVAWCCSQVLSALNGRFLAATHVALTDGAAPEQAMTSITDISLDGQRQTLRRKWLTRHALTAQQVTAQQVTSQQVDAEFMLKT